MEDNANAPEKKLYVDEDWKAQVEREQEAARHAAEQQETTGQGSQPQAEQPQHPGEGTLPPPDLTFLIGSLYMQAIVAMGLAPNPGTNKAEPHLEEAKLFIDLLTMLEQKTEGNRTPQESEELDGVLHQLRLAFLAVSEQPKPQS